MFAKFKRTMWDKTPNFSCRTKPVQRTGKIAPSFPLGQPITARDSVNLGFWSLLGCSVVTGDNGVKKIEVTPTKQDIGATQSPLVPLTPLGTTVTDSHLRSFRSNVNESDEYRKVSKVRCFYGVRNLSGMKLLFNEYRKVSKVRCCNGGVRNLSGMKLFFIGIIQSSNKA